MTRSNSDRGPAPETAAAHAAVVVVDALDARTLQRLRDLTTAILAENRVVNLTATTNFEKFWSAHVCDSLALLPLVAGSQKSRLLDLGTGGGLPGLPLAVVRSDLEITLLDATRKKLDAVKRVADSLGLKSVATLWGRAERLAHVSAQRESYDVVTARAVAALPVLIELAAGFLRPGGMAWFYKSLHALDAELPAARENAHQCSMMLQERHSYDLPARLGPRVLLGFQKTGPLPAHLPRAAAARRRGRSDRRG